VAVVAALVTQIVAVMKVVQVECNKSTMLSY
jgi:hypothetical protein